MGISRQSVGSAENGRTKPRRITINAWALACGVPAYWLLTGDTENPHPDGPGGGAECPLSDSNGRPADYRSVDRGFNVRELVAA